MERKEGRIVVGEEDDSTVESMMTSGTEDTVERESIGGELFSFAGRAWVVGLDSDTLN